MITKNTMVVVWERRGELYAQPLTDNLIAIGKSIYIVNGFYDSRYFEEMTNPELELKRDLGDEFVAYTTAATAVKWFAITSAPLTRLS